VLGIDNVIFIAIIAGRLPEKERDKARIIGLSLAVITRIMLLFMLSWLMQLTTPLFSVMSHAVSGKDLILIVGGLFLVGKATHEIHAKLEEPNEGMPSKKGSRRFWGIIVQILLLDIIFSLDSVITAVGMVNNLTVMIAAIITSIIIMLVFSKAIVNFINIHPTIKMLALSFLILIGVVLMADGFGQHINKAYIYFAMAFSLGVEMLNIKLGTRKKG
jgi:predicted tellurium resistance membrane protein TerC